MVTQLFRVVRPARPAPPPAASSAPLPPDPLKTLSSQQQTVARRANIVIVIFVLQGRIVRGEGKFHGPAD
eukprot:41392-Hanusia_phi.AAC.2